MNSPTESAPKAAALRQTGPLQQRSLSLPLSRLVLNPQDFNSEASEVVQNCDATLPLGLGYYAFDEAIAIPRALSVWAPRATPAPLVPTEALPPSGWASGEGAVVETVDGALRVSLARGGDSYIGTAVTSVVLDADKPVLRIAVRSVSGQWALHLGATSEVMILPGAATLGLLHLDLRDHLPHGIAGRTDLRLSVIGARSHVVVDEFRFVPALGSERVGALGFDTDWTPGGLGLTARYPWGGARGTDAFVDLDSVVRELVFDEPLPAESPVMVVGRHIAAPEHDPVTSTVTMVTATLSAVVAVPDGGEIRYYADESELAAGEEGSTTPRSAVGVWAIRLLPGRTRYRVGLGVTPDDPRAAATLALAAAGADAEERREHWLAYWDERIARMPQPADFAVRGVDPVDVTGEMVRAAYYQAFIALYANVLPPQPETGFDCPVVATGKASMWNHGAPGARSAAAWETFLAIQYLAYVDAGLAWQCFNGLMSLVDDAGSLAGEGLPSRKAQTAWVLYSLTGDREALAAGYPGLRRLLEWQAAHPRWVYGTYDNPGEQDAEFVTSLILDLVFGSAIAEVLGRDDDLRLFARLDEQLRADYASNSFAGPGRDAIQHWFADDETASMRGGPDGLGLQVAMGLAVPGLEDWQVESLLRRFDAQFDATDQLAGFDFVKHSNAGLTAVGLLAHDRPESARALLNAMLRDVIRSGSFAEVYDRGPERPRPWGVRPSIFGMTQVIDSVWLNNGLRMDRGMPQAIALEGAAGGVTGIPLRGRRYSLSVSGADATLTEQSPGGAVVEFTAGTAGTGFPSAAAG